MAAGWVVGERIGVRLEDPDARSRRYLERAMDPYAPSAPDAVDVALEAAADGERPRLTEIQNPAGDALVTAVDGHHAYVLRRDEWCRLPTKEDGLPARFRYSPGFPLAEVAGLLRTVMQLELLDRSAVALHAAAVERHGDGLVVAGWSETGKTETALAFMEEGARFLSDKWVVLGDDSVLRTFPITVGVRRWVLDYLPRLRASLTRAARAQFAAAGVADRLTGPLRRARAGGRIAGLASSGAERAVRLADRAALTPSDLIAAYGQQDAWQPSAGLGRLVFLTTVPGREVEVREVDPDRIAARLSQSAAFERRRLFELYQRARFALPEHRGLDMAAAIERERRFLVDALDGIELLEARAPFPTDPRRVADAVGRQL